MLTEPGQRVVIEAFGETPMDAVEHQLRVEPQPPPDPSELNPTDVVIAVKACAVGWVDLLMTSGQYQHMASPPYTPGLEYSGVVAWAGAEVNLAVGDRVLADGLLTGPRSIGAYQRWGGFASYAVAPSAAVIPLPTDWTFGQGCCLLGNYETAYHCLIARGGLLAGETALIMGASGSTGLAAVHLAKIMGANVIATGRSPAKLADVKRQGADHVICVADDHDGPAFSRQVKALTGGSGVQLVYDGVGGPASIQAIRSAAFGARYLVVGWASTPFVARGRGQRGAPNANQLPTNLIMMKGLDVLGCPTAITTHRNPAIREPRLQELFRWVHQGQLVPYVATSFPFEQVKEAMHAKWKSRFVGGCVLEMP